MPSNSALIDWALSNIATPAARYTVDCLGTNIATKIRYLLEYENNLERFKGLAGELEALKTDVLRKVDDAQDIEEVVLQWLAEAIQIEMDREVLEEKIQKNQGGCNPLPLDWWLRIQLSEFAADKTAKIKQLLSSKEIKFVSYGH